MKILQRYLAASFIKPFVFGTLFFVIFLLTFQMFRVVGLIISKGMDFSYVGTIIWQVGLSLIPLAMPMAIYFSVLFVMGKISDDSELVVMRASGMSKFDLLKPFLFVSLIAGLALFFIGDILAPRGKLAFKKKLVILKTQGDLTDIKPGEFFTLIPNVTLFATEFDMDKSTLKDVFIQFIEKDGTEKTIMSDIGIIHKKNLENGQTKISFTLKKGNILQIQNDKFEKILFDRYEFPIELGEKWSFYPKERDMEGSDLKVYLDKGPEKASNRKNYYKALIEYYNRRNNSFLVVALSLLAFSLGFKNTRGRSRHGFRAFVYLVGYYSLYFLGVSFATSGKYPVAPFVFGPTVFLLLLSLYHYRKMEWS